MRLRFDAYLVVHKRQFGVTAIIEAAPEGGFWAICPEVPGANGQGETLEEKNTFRQAIELILDDSRVDIRLPERQIVITAR